MTSKLWVHAGNGSGEAVPAEAVAALMREGLLTGESRIRPHDVDSWAPISVWLPELAGERPPAPAEPPALPGAKGAWTDTQPHPWRRYFARMFDGLIIGGLTWFLISIVAYIAAPEAADGFFRLFEGPVGRLLDVMLTLLAMIPGTALMIGLTGVSIGKWIFGIKVVTPEGRPIGFARALGREVQVWFWGMGVGFPLLSLAAMVVSYNQLLENKRARWDPPKQRIVLYRPMNALQITLLWLAIPLLIAGRIGLTLLGNLE